MTALVCSDHLNWDRGLLPPPPPDCSYTQKRKPSSRGGHPLRSWVGKHFQNIDFSMYLLIYIDIWRISYKNIDIPKIGIFSLLLNTWDDLFLFILSNGSHENDFCFFQDIFDIVSNGDEIIFQYFWGKSLKNSSFVYDCHTDDFFLL